MSIKKLEDGRYIVDMRLNGGKGSASVANLKKEVRP